MARTSRQRWATVTAFVLTVALLGASVWWISYRQALTQLAARGQADLSLAASRLTGQLQRFQELAVLLADHPDLTQLVFSGQPQAAPNVLLQEIVDKTGSLDILVLDRQGRELAHTASQELTLDHNEKPYFQRAMTGALGFYHVLTTQNRRAFLAAAPMFSAQGPANGSVVVVADIEGVETDWRGDRPTIFFTDDLGVVFVSNRSELALMRRDSDADGGFVASVNAEYDSAALRPFFDHRIRRLAGQNLWQAEGGPYIPRRALHLTQDLPVIGMTGEALLDLAPVVRIANLQAAVAAALFLAFGAVLFLATERRRTLADANTVLEARVAARTAELQKAQADLVQAGKLTALGQMSAGISHELNQPLMAIRSFAENAATFLDQGKADVAADNLGRISDLARRMGRIIKNLRAFARQETEPVSDVDFAEVIDAALEVTAMRVRESGTQLHWTPPPQAIWVRGGDVRLQQVVVNLITNAIDAMDGLPAKRLDLDLSAEQNVVTFSLRDYGPGIDDAEKIFDPFYTTKEVGHSEGMGLGLSISYGLIQSFGGAIRGQNHPDGGAIFTVTLQPSQAQAAA
ncbi:ATP-binding protein [Algirhabdus cladophorae]|uniref:sensor histidine kinase n=1 Tax=Algirhabdus cladophorae TaxID=3377108 RepID=UPI003B848E61